MRSPTQRIIAILQKLTIGIGYFRQAIAPVIGQRRHPTPYISRRRQIPLGIISKRLISPIPKRLLRQSPRTIITIDKRIPTALRRLRQPPRRIVVKSLPLTISVSDPRQTSTGIIAIGHLIALLIRHRQRRSRSPTVRKAHRLIQGISLAEQSPRRIITKLINNISRSRNLAHIPLRIVSKRRRSAQCIGDLSHLSTARKVQRRSPTRPVLDFNHAGGNVLIRSCHNSNFQE